MAPISAEELPALLLNREEQLYSRLLLNRVFQGMVTAVTGTTPNVVVQVVRPGERVSDGMTYPVLTTWDPMPGDGVDIIWRDDDVGLAAFPTSTNALNRIPPRHPYRARLYWTGTFTTLIGWNPIGYNNIDYDPSNMVKNSTLIIPATGTYLVTVKGGITGPGSIDTVAGIYWQGGLITQGSRAGSTAQNESTVTDIRVLNTGDVVAGYLYQGVAGGALESGSVYNYMTACLLSR